MSETWGVIGVHVFLHAFYGLICTTTQRDETTSTSRMRVTSSSAGRVMCVRCRERAKRSTGALDTGAKLAKKLAAVLGIPLGSKLGSSVTGHRVPSFPSDLGGFQIH